MPGYHSQDVGAVLKAVAGDTVQTAWNGAADVNGDAINRLTYNNPKSALVVVVVTGGGTDVINFKIQDSADGSTFADYATTESKTGGALQIDEATAVSGGFRIDLAGARQYVRVVLLDTSTVATTAAVATAFVFGGAKVNG